MTEITPLEVRQNLVNTLRYDIVGPGLEGFRAEERIPIWLWPSKEYVTGFLVPTGAPPEQRSDLDSEDQDDVVPERAGLPEESTEDQKAAKKSFYPSSMGMSFMLDAATESIDIGVHWGDYRQTEVELEVKNKEGETKTKIEKVWQRIPESRKISWDIPEPSSEPIVLDVPDSGGLQLFALSRSVNIPVGDGSANQGSRSLSLFLVNHRDPIEDAKDEAFIFQAELEIKCSSGFLERPDFSELHGEDWNEGDDKWDEYVNDLHFSDAPEYATGHGISVTWDLEEGKCLALRSCWVPEAFVEKTATAKLENIQLSIDALGSMTTGDEAQKMLQPLVDQYRVWIAEQGETLSELSEQREDIAKGLLIRAENAAERMESGILLLKENPNALEAFCIANRAVSSALRKRLPDVDKPEWRAFQLAFQLLNLRGMAEKDHAERDIVDLLFFPTGGGKTEAYLGLAAFAMVYRRLENPGLSGAGVSVIMRYTLRLLTLDQMSRAATLVCALELEREQDEERLGSWPFEIGLWVGQAATPNKLGRRGDDRNSARSKVRAFKNDPKGKPSPIPLEECPWCQTKFSPDSFNLSPNDDNPKELKITCASTSCDFVRDRNLPIVAIDEPLYRRLPAFLIATVDKFASLPWIGKSGGLLGGATRSDSDGFYGPAEPGIGNQLEKAILPPDLIIQDELHLISGPLGTIAGLYETALEALCLSELDGATVKPKIVASTATAKQAQTQVRALFGRHQTDLFPPAGPNRRDSFFAETRNKDEVPARQYLAVPVQGRAARLVMQRVWLTLLCAAEKDYRQAGGDKAEKNPADAYMSIMGYFNSLKELGSARRVLEETVKDRAGRYSTRLRIGEKESLFRDRNFMKEVVELTSRVSTDKVSDAKRKLATPYSSRDDRVDCAIATNMISVGLDITRLGVMVVQGQPKTSSEYIQATSRVGRDEKLGPGLVITVLNTYRPRDRSHYERFRHYHETFYRSVEVASVTPFSARALDRSLAGAVVTLARHSLPELTPAQGVQRMPEMKVQLMGKLLAAFRTRADDQRLPEEEKQQLLLNVQDRIHALMESWEEVLDYYVNDGVKVQYQKHEETGPKHLLREMLDTDFINEHHRKFKVSRSMRGVEPSVNLFLKNLTTEGGDA